MNFKIAFLTLLTLLFILLSVQTINNFKEGGDTDTYIVGAKAIFEGKGYSDISIAGSPLITLFPPGYSIILSVLFLSGENFYIFAKLTSLLCAIGSIVLFNFLCEKFFSKRVSLFVTALFAFNLLFVWYSTKILSDMVFSFLILAIVLMLDSLSEKSKTFTVAIVSLIASFAIVLRMAGIFMVAAVPIVVFLKTKSFKKSIFSGLVSFLLIASWLFFSVSADNVSGSPMRYINQILSAELSSTEASSINLFEIGFVFLRNTFFYLFKSIPEAVFPVLDVASFFYSSTLFFILGALVLSFVIVGFISSLSRFKTIHVFTLLYFVPLLVLNYVDNSVVDRYLLPVLGFLLIFFYLGLKFILDVYVPETSKKVFLAVMLFSLVLSIGSSLVFVSTVDDRQQDLNYTNYVSASDWIAKNTNENAVVLSDSSRKTFLFTSRVGVPFNVVQEIQSKTDLEKAIQDYSVDYILVDDYGSNDSFIFLLEGNYEKVFSVREGKTAVYLVGGEKNGER